ncbi:MAG: UDP-glucose 4-epimerase GalE [Reyranellaceae bacterium]
MAAREAAGTLLVTGGAGYIGSHVCKAAAIAGYLPVTFDSLAGGHRHAVRWGPLEVGDLRDGPRIRAALERWRPAAVVHLAGLIDTAESVADPGRYYLHNVVASMTLLDAMRQAGVASLIFSSSAAVYGEPAYAPIDEAHPCAPLSPYGASKMMVERILRDYAGPYGVTSVALRYFNAAGADPDGEIGEAHPTETHLVPLVLEALAGRRKSISVHGTDYDTRDGTCVRDYIHVGDLADAHVLAVKFLEEQQQKGAHAFNLGSGEGATVREIIEAAGRLANRPVPVTFGARRPGDPAVLLANPRRAQRQLGWKPVRSDVETIIATAWAWHRKAWCINAA